MAIEVGDYDGFPAAGPVRALVERGLRPCREKASMYEVEVKVRADHAAVRDHLDEAGADSRGTVVQADTYYDAPDRDFAETDEAVRIRREERDGEWTTKLTYKGPKIDAQSKTREEFEVEVDSDDTLAAILEGMGFTEAAVVRKTRAYFRLGEYTVVLDAVEGLGEFVEVEIESADVEAARGGAMDVLDRLGLDPDEQIRTSYLGLLLEDTQ